MTESDRTLEQRADEDVVLKQFLEYFTPKMLDGYMKDLGIRENKRDVFLHAYIHKVLDPICEEYLRLHPDES